MITSHYAKAYKSHVHTGKRFNRARQDLSVPRSFSPRHVCKRLQTSDTKRGTGYVIVNKTFRGETPARSRRARDRARIGADALGRASESARVRFIEDPREIAGETGRHISGAHFSPRVNANAYPPWYHSLHTSHCIINCWGSYERPQKQYVADGSISLTVTSIVRNSCDRVLSTTVAEVT